MVSTQAKRKLRPNVYDLSLIYVGPRSSLYIYIYNILTR